ncbi:CENP-S associating centromere protein X-domain-containing protein [Rhexocercosporidium sp. MPI-PUGE-AT-0058]|nr:CENP-S associating centromere protein X-domain-containing protein [Rhexocercosporidium sp. MPI-PUGE-AT-0058]
MPPKPFNPPRPSTSNTGAGTKPRGRPKGSVNNPSSTTKRKSTVSTIDKPSKSKAKSAGKGKDKDMNTSRGSGFSRPRVSNASTVLNISSGDEDEEDEDEDEDVEMGSGEEVAEREEGEDDEDPFSSQPPAAARRKSNTSKPTPRQAAADDDREIEGGGRNGGKADGRQISIPPDLINVIIHGFFNQDNTRMSRDANAAVGRYIETFVREGLNRADWAKRHGWEEGGLESSGVAGGSGMGDGGAYLEVEDLERLAPQLLLDF